MLCVKSGPFVPSTSIVCVPSDFSLSLSSLPSPSFNPLSMMLKRFLADSRVIRGAEEILHAIWHLKHPICHLNPALDVNTF